MQHTIIVRGRESAVIIQQAPTVYIATTYWGETPMVTSTHTTFAQAEHWAKAVIGYPDAEA